MFKVISLFILVVSTAEGRVLIRNHKFVLNRNRVYGGIVAEIGSAPHQASLRLSSNSSFHFCGGSIISPCHILTAAHCVDECPCGGCLVGYGNNDLRDQTLVPIESFIPHEEFTLDQDEDEIITFFSNDIAIIKLKECIPEFNDDVNMIELNTECLPLGISVTTTGWGVIDSDFTETVTLLETTLLVSACPAAESSWFQFICTTAMETGICVGDSGGPMIYKGKLAGVTSYGSDCGESTSEDAFSDVSYYLEWIQEKMRTL